jgi:hypothetical protein
MDLLLIRHAQPVRIGPGEGGGGPVDPELTGEGRVQAQRLAEWLAGEALDAVITSPLRRARETAAPTAATHALDVQVAPELIEYDARADHYIPAEELKIERDARWHAMIEGRWADFGGEPPDQSGPGSSPPSTTSSRTSPAAGSRSFVTEASSTCTSRPCSGSTGRCGSSPGTPRSAASRQRGRDHVHW